MLIVFMANLFKIFEVILTFANITVLFVVSLIAAFNLSKVKFDI